MVYLLWLVFSTIFFFIVYEILKKSLEKYLAKELDRHKGDQ